MNRIIFILNLLIISLPFLSTSFARASGEEAIALADEILCQRRLVLGIHETKEVMARWFQSESSSQNLLANFNTLKGRHDEHFSAIDRFAKMPYEATPDAAALAGQLHQVDLEFRTFLAENRSITQLDEVFLTSLGDIEKRLAALDATFGGDVSRCAATTREKAAQFLSTKRTLQGRVAAMRSYVAKAAQKRETLLRMVKEARKYEYQNRYAQKTLTSLADVRKTIDGIFRAGDLIEAVSDWGTDFRNRTPCSKYLQFESCVTAVESALARGRPLWEQIEKASVADNHRKDLQDKFKFHESYFQKQLAELKANGWESFFKDQTFNLNEGILANPDYFGPECMGAAKLFAAAAAGVKDLTSYRKAEPLYVAMAKICIFGGEGDE